MNFYFPGMEYVPHAVVALVIAAGIGCYRTGFMNTLWCVGPGLLLLVAGFGLTLSTGGNTVFVGAMGLGALLAVIGIFTSVFGRRPN